MYILNWRPLPWHKRIGGYEIELQIMKFHHLPKLISLFVFLLGSITNAFAQKKQIDSLSKLLALEKIDTNYVKRKNELAWAYFQAKESKMAKKLVLENIEKAKKLNWNKGIANSFETIGDFYWQEDKLDSAIILTRNAILFYKKTKDNFQICFMLNRIGSRLLYMQKYAESKQSFVESYDIAIKIRNLEYQFKNIESLGWLYLNMGNHVKSLEYLTTAEKLAIKMKDKLKQIDLATGFANNYIALEKYKEAQNKQLEAATFYKLQNNDLKYTYHLAIVANLYRKLGEPEKAEKPLLEVYEIQKNIKDSFNLLTTSRFLGMLYTDQKKYKKAEKFLKESLQLADKYKNGNDKIKAYYTFERLYFAKNDFIEGDKFQKLILKMRDSLYTAENNKALAEFDIKYKTAEKEAKLKEAQLEIAEKQNWIIALSLGFLGILITGGLLWRISSIKSKAEETEKLKNIEIENQKKLLSAKEIERQRIAKELHDSVGSQLTVVSTSLDNAFYLFENQKLMPEKLENISGEVRLAAQSLRDTIWATYNSEISVADLKSRIQEFIKKFADENAFKLEMEISGDQTVLNPIEGLNLFRIVQESLNNIQKYAQASLVKIEGNFEKDNYNLKISDNGLGFDLSKANIGNSYGLSNMKSRAEEIGGILIIDSKKNIGTSVFFEKTVI